MAPPRKPEPGRRRQVFVRLPDDIADRIDAKAAVAGHTITRVIINELAAHPHLDRQAKLAELVANMEVTLAKYGARITMVGLSEDLLRALDAALAARTDGQLQPQLDRLRVVRMAMLENERQLAKMEHEQFAAEVEQFEQQRAAEVERLAQKIEAIAALPAGAPMKDDLAALKDELLRLRQAAALRAAGRETAFNSDSRRRELDDLARRRP